MSPFKTKLSLAAAALLAVSCAHLMPGGNAQSVPMTTQASGIPAAQGAIKMREGKNDNKQLVVQVEHLAPPAKIADGATTYVVWAQPEGVKQPQNIGALKVDNKLKGSLTTVLPYDSFKVFITAEPTPSVTEPSGKTLLAANIDD